MTRLLVPASSFMEAACADMIAAGTVAQRDATRQAIGPDGSLSSARETLLILPSNRSGPRHRYVFYSPACPVPAKPVTRRRSREFGHRRL
jgi:hypothetical protein